jgi:cytochrome c oxidase subunit 5a
VIPDKLVIESALKAARRLNDYPTALRTLEALKVKLPNGSHYRNYLVTIQPLIDELGIGTTEELHL